MAQARRYDIDFLRVVGSGLVFIFHTLQPFNSSETWHIRNELTIPFAGSTIWFLNLWIMPFFMLLAGSSGHLHAGGTGARSNPGVQGPQLAGDRPLFPTCNFCQSVGGGGGPDL